MERFTSLKGQGLVFLSLLFFVWFLNFTGRAIFSPILPLIEDEFQISHARASSIFVFQSLGYGMSIFFSGFFSGRFGYKRSIMLSLIVSSLIFFWIPFVKAFSILYVCSFVIGLATGVYLPSAIPLITSYFEEKLWGRSIAIHDSAASIAVFAASFVALFLLQFFNWRGIFNVVGVAFILTALIFYFLFDELKIGRVNRAVLGSFIRQRSLWLMSVIWAFAAGTSMGVYFIVPLYLTKELFLDIAYANTIFGLSRIGGVVVAVSSGFLVNRFSLQKLMVSLLVISGVFTISVALVSTKFMGLALFLQASFIYGFFPVGLVTISRIFEMEVRGMATGFILGIGIIIGWGVVPYLLGLSGDLLSFRFGILMLGIAVVLSSGLVFLLQGLPLPEPVPLLKSTIISKSQEET